VNLKSEPDRAIELREEYEDVQPGWHMNKTHWNSVYIERGLRTDLIREMIDRSYDLIVESLPKKARLEMGK